MKVVHIVENLDKGAVENWLVRMLRHAVSRGVALDWTFYCALGAPGRLDAEAAALGGRIVHSPVPLRDKVAFLRTLRHALRHGRYDVMHCHHDLMSAAYLAAAVGLPIRRRIVHVHNADEALPTPNRLKSAVARPMLRAACLARADRIVGISNHTLDTFLAGRARRPGRDIVHYYGIDPTPFDRAGRDRSALRHTLGLAEDSRLLLFAGRMVPEKNPLFAVDVLAELVQRDRRWRGVFVGAGGLDAAVAERARAHGLGAVFRQLGWRSDVAAIMGACDLFILPHPEVHVEGFGIAVVEAQLAGLRLLISRGVADDPLLPTAVYRRLGLAEGPSAWAAAGHDLLDAPGQSPAAARAALRQSPMDMDRALRGLCALHADAEDAEAAA